jgi:hypothetical protein
MYHFLERMHAFVRRILNFHIMLFTKFFDYMNMFKLSINWPVAAVLNAFASKSGKSY